MSQRVMGRPSTGGGRKYSFRLSPYLIVKMGLKKVAAYRNEGSYGRDSEILHKYLRKGIDEVQSGMNLLKSPRTPRSALGRGWTYDLTSFNLWISSELQKQLDSLNHNDLPTSLLVQRLIVTGAAAENIVQPEELKAEDLPDPASYQELPATVSKKVEPAQATVNAVQAREHRSTISKAPKVRVPLRPVSSRIALR